VGFVGGLVAFPAGLALGGLATEVKWPINVTGTEWFVYKACVAVCVIAGFAIGQALCEGTGRQKSLAEQSAPQSSEGVTPKTLSNWARRIYIESE